MRRAHDSHRTRSRQRRIGEDRMKVLVTGGAGFIGSHLSEALLAAGHAVTVIDDLTTGRPDNLAGSADSPELRTCWTSLLEEGELQFFVENADIVYHLAAA